MLGHPPARFSLEPCAEQLPQVCSQPSPPCLAPYPRPSISVERELQWTYALQGHDVGRQPWTEPQPQWTYALQGHDVLLLPAISLSGRTPCRAVTLAGSPGQSLSLGLSLGLSTPFTSLAA
ncbi:unnamed protein product [Rangifer tarandus platyrhynchus]|uniref:Uncharacterized protein n=1 Tax=Rangifer tarandus platyrhynchus TaxID=3082113 RepID=A0AC59YDS0_RANTA